MTVRLDMLRIWGGHKQGGGRTEESQQDKAEIRKKQEAKF